MSAVEAGDRKAGFAQGITVVLAGFLPILAIVSMFPAVGAMIGHFAPSDPSAATKVPSMVTAPGLTIALVALLMGVLVDKYGRRRLLLISTFSYGFIGVLPFFLEDLDWIYASRLLLGLDHRLVFLGEDLHCPAPGFVAGLVIVEVVRAGLRFGGDDVSRCFRPPRMWGDLANGRCGGLPRRSCPCCAVACRGGCAPASAAVQGSHERPRTSALRRSGGRGTRALAGSNSATIPRAGRGRSRSGDRTSRPPRRSRPLPRASRRGFRRRDGWPGCR